MVQKSIGLALVAIAIIAFVMTWFTGSTTAALSPFVQVPYYPAFPATGKDIIAPNGGGLPVWLIPALCGAGGLSVLFAVVALRARRL